MVATPTHEKGEVPFRCLSFFVPGSCSESMDLGTMQLKRFAQLHADKKPPALLCVLTIIVKAPRLRRPPK